MEVLVKILKKLGLYDFAKKTYIKRRKRQNLKGKYKFINRSKNNKKMCMILAGYKTFSYEIVFKRIKKFVPKDVDVCILSSGIYSEELAKISEKNNWSYLSTKRNCVSLIQNIAVSLFPNAEYIYKLDEDIFVTKNFFNTLYKTLNDCEKNGDYRVGFVAPTIPINSFGNLNILKRFNLVEKYTKRFEKPLYALGADRMDESNKDAVEFFWGEGGYLPNIDVMDKTLNDDKFSYLACPIRFSIGAILMKRSFFEEMGMFKVSKFGSCMGVDEQQICNYCMDSSHAIIVSLNTVVGHLSFGVQNENMKNYYLNHKDVFDIHNVK
jgi:hypothetical protein